MATTAIAAENEWAKANPVPRSEVSGNLLILWNYPVAKSELATVHKNALRRFLVLLGGPGRFNSEVTVHGHASDTGDSKANDVLALARAQGVAQFLRSEGLTSKQIFVSSAGSAEPFDQASSGLALARNRRVDVTRDTPAPAEPPLPPIDLGGEPVPSQPPPTTAPKAELPGVPSSPIYIPKKFEIKFVCPFPPIRTAEVFMDVTFEGSLSCTVDDRGGGWSSGEVLNLKDNRLSIKAEGEVVKNVIGKITFEPAVSGKPASLKVGVEKKDLPFSPEGGWQVSTKFVYITLTVGESDPFDVVLGGTVIKSKVKGKLKVEVGPGPAMVARGARAAAAAGQLLVEAAPAAALASPFIVAALVIGGTALAIQDAKEKADELVAVLASRDGAASRVAVEIAGTDSTPGLDDRRRQWKNRPLNLEADFNSGVSAVENMLRDGKARADKSAAWKAKFASDGSNDFAVLRQRVYIALGGNDRERRGLVEL